MLKVIFVDLGGLLVKEGYTTGIRDFAVSQKFNQEDFFAACHDYKYWKDFTLGLISEEEYFQEIEKIFGKKFDWRELQRYIQNHTELKEDVLSLLKKLKKDFILGTISNHPSEWYKWTKIFFGLEKLFDIEVVAGIVHKRKPDPSIFKFAIDKAGMPAKEIIYIDDSDKHFSGALTVGMNVAKCSTIEEIKRALF
jgi:HAD superfamily hydrolase (TIGR01509 family)